MIDNFKLVESAHNDLGAAKLLFENGFFCQSVFFTQQSIEKISKFIVLDTDAIRFEELQRKIGHNAIEAFRIAIESKSEILTQVSNLRKNDSSVTPNFLNLDKGLEGFKETMNFVKSYDLENLKEKELAEIIEVINSIQSNIHGSYFNKSDLLGMNISEYLEFLNRNHLINSDQRDELISGINSNENLRVFLDNFFRKFVDCFPNYIAALLRMFFVSMAFTRHAVSSRYPDITRGFDPSEHYNLNNPLVKEIPFFHGAINQSMKAIADYNIIMNHI